MHKDRILNYLPLIDSKTKSLVPIHQSLFIVILLAEVQYATRRDRWRPVG
jgi:hypothetical protein